jgi:hypothetical protein
MRLGALLGARDREARLDGAGDEPSVRHTLIIPYRKNNKNDPNDAEAICEAVTQAVDTDVLQPF